MLRKRQFFGNAVASPAMGHVPPPLDFKQFHFQSTFE